MERIREWIQELPEWQFILFALLVAIVSSSAMVLYWNMWDMRHSEGEPPTPPDPGEEEPVAEEPEEEEEPAA